jgi:hypothetical protein
MRLLTGVLAGRLGRTRQNRRRARRPFDGGFRKGRELGLFARHAGRRKTLACNYAARGKRIGYIIGARHPGFLKEQDFFTEEEILSDPLRREILGDTWPEAAGFGAATAVLLPTGETIIFGLERNRDCGFVGAEIVARLDELRPHLARVALFSARLQLQQARAAAETLGLIGLPALVFDQGGKVIAANRLIEALTDIAIWRGDDP